MIKDSLLEDFLQPPAWLVTPNPSGLLRAAFYHSAKLERLRLRSSHLSSGQSICGKAERQKASKDILDFQSYRRQSFTFSMDLMNARKGMFILCFKSCNPV